MFQEQTPNDQPDWYFKVAYSEAAAAVIAAALLGDRSVIEIDPPEPPFNSWFPGGIPREMNRSQHDVIDVAGVAGMTLFDNKDATWLDVYNKALQSKGSRCNQYFEREALKTSAKKAMILLRRHWPVVEEIVKNVAAYQEVSRKTLYEITPEMLGLHARKKKTRK